ncbi:MAG: iron-sulfur cluster repair di-iron protein [Flavobacteriales bacterium]|jgi:regulator of cell morphogenesis and NO signaling|nr:iron-sulfur cluster repair di-iron protein [Flavobacteriales bacterium]MBK6892080.1 iron-sulfur cluster repair di-iron protein [Flavobacteriales bacterium]MBK7246215.1 iron-sulfur cluster repair di-iron protein [Flavobacteriales bacterium]MBK9060020.1 iron-sulfur cluster repair di-iron protein [Flavobacteriales bacterium]MBK9597251.1 iron-sulfur cluster repair di-iron protein [Flavobacteriales bacterium]
MKITPERTVGSIVAEDYRAAAVLTKYGIDFCCKGGRSVQEVCENKNIDQNKLAEDITTLLARDAKSGDDARTWPLDQLADHVETVHHRYVEERGPIIQQYLAKLCRVHGERHPELFTINDEFNACVGAMASHMKKEELVLFPFVRNLAKSERSNEPFKTPHFGTVENPVNMMMEDHVAEGERFERMGAVSDSFTPPADGCATYATAFSMLKEFEEDLHLHIHLENNIMFPRAIALERSLAHVAN